MAAPQKDDYHEEEVLPRRSPEIISFYDHKENKTLGRLGRHYLKRTAYPASFTDKVLNFLGLAAKEQHFPIAGFGDTYTSEYLRYRVKKIGQPPGILLHFGRISAGKVKLSMIEYSEGAYAERENASIQDCLSAPLSEQVTWINISGIHNTRIVERLGEHFKLHPLVLEDIVNAAQRSKLDVYQDHLFFIMRLIFEHRESGGYVDEQISFVLGVKYLITFLEEDRGVFQHIRQQLRKDKSHIRSRGPDYLCYALIDAIVDQHFIVLEKIDERIEALETELIADSKPETLFKIHHLKQEVLLLKKSIWPMREVINGFRRAEGSLVSNDTKLFLHDVYDHTIQAIDTVESFRDIASGMLDVYISSINYRMNEIMKVLTVVSTIFVPLTFIASVYGMNFKNMPELDTAWGYYVVLGVMTSIFVSMLIFFRYKRWL